TNQPGARDAVDVNALARHPDTAPKIVGGRVMSLRLQRHGRRPEARLEIAHSALGCFAARRGEEVDPADLREASPEPGRVGLQLEPTLSCDSLSWELRFELPRRLDDLRVVGISGGVEGSLDLFVAQAIDESRLAERRLATLFDDLPKHPLEVLSGL